MCVVGLTHHFNFWTIFNFILWCHSTHVFLSGCILLHASKGCTSFSPPCVRTFMHHTWLSTGWHTFSHSKLSYFPLRTTTVKALYYHPRLGLLLQIVWGQVGNSHSEDPLKFGKSNTINNVLELCIVLTSLSEELEVGINLKMIRYSHGFMYLLVEKLRPIFLPIYALIIAIHHWNAHHYNLFIGKCDIFLFNKIFCFVFL